MMWRTVFLVIALLTFGIGVFSVWYITRPSPPLSQFRVQIPSAPVPLTPEQIAVLPNDDSNLVVSIERGGQLSLNGSEGVGNVAEQVDDLPE